MRNLFVFLPLLFLAIAWLVGRARITSALNFLNTWMLACVLVNVGTLFLYEFEHIGLRGLLVGLIVSFVMAATSLVFAVFYSIQTSKPVSPAPIEVVAEGAAEVCGAAHQTYQKLDPDQKEKFWKGAKVAARFAANLGATHLRERGKGAYAEVLDRAAKHI